MGAVFAALDGDELTMVGAALTVKQAAQLPEPASGLVTVMLPAPGSADGDTSTMRSSSPLDLNVVEVAWTLVLLNETVAPFWKCEPVIVTALPAAPGLRLGRVSNPCSTSRKPCTAA